MSGIRLTELFHKKIHNRRNFTCGEPALDRYLQQQSSQDVRRGLTALYVWSDENRQIIGYYTLSAADLPTDSVRQETLQALKYPTYKSIPAILIGRLALTVDRQGDGQSAGKLLMDALYRCLDLSEQLGAAGVVVNAKNERAIRFYRKYGFLTLQDSENTLFLPMKTIPL